MSPDEYVLGGCLLNADAIPFATKMIDPGDFANPRHDIVFTAMVELHKAGQPVEPFTVYTKAIAHGAKGLDITELHRWMEGTGSGASVEHYASEVREAANRRRLSMAGARFHQDLADQAIPPADTVARMLETLADIRERSTNGDLSAKTLGEVLDTPEVPEDWVIPGLLERGDRMIITGIEGLGKTTWIRQIAISAASGLNPITLDQLTAPVRTLVVDVENSEKQWRRETYNMAAMAAQLGVDSPRDNLVLHTGARMDLRKDRDLGLVHRLVDVHKPEILVIGPIYRLIPNGINNDEEAAPLIAALDTLRDRGLVLIIEAHAPKGDGQHRNLAPRGSAALMGWPEFGFGLDAMDDGNGQVSGAKVTRWRMDRDRRRGWPMELYKSSGFPWVSDQVSPAAKPKLYGWNKAA